MSLETVPRSPENNCRRCGRPLPPDAPGGNCPACLWALATEDEAPPPQDEATRHFGSYELVEEIARGGMGVVWRARQDGLDRDVALKMILTGHLATSAQVIRFYTEARAAARLDHPGIVPIHEIGEDGGCHFYTMRLMQGGSLADLLRTVPRPAPQEAARIMLAVSRAIHFAHQRGVLHRDVKPSNILLDAEGKPHVADFGLARIAESDSSASRSGSIVGTPAYMAPEQAAGSPSEVTTAADVYGLGAVLYELLTGEPPFQASSPLQTLRRLVETEPAPPRSRDPQIPRDLEVICLKCLQKEPERRYASAGELADDLERWLRGEPILARPVSAFARLVSWARRKRELAAALAALLLLLLTALAVTSTLLVQVRRQSAARAEALRAEEGQRLAFQSLAVVEDNPGQALLLALEAAAREPSASANNALLVAMEACRERRRFLGHRGSLGYVSFSPDGGRLVTSSYDRTARVWDVRTGETICVLRGHEGVVRTSVFSPDGDRMVTASDDATARIWDAASGEALAVLAGHSHPLASARFSPDGRRVLTVAQDTARIWDGESREVVHSLDHPTAEVFCASFSPDGGRVVTAATDGSAKVWDVTTGGALGALVGHSSWILDVCFSADGTRIATASDPEARVWDASTFEVVCVLRGHEHGIYSVALSADGSKAVTGSEDFTARIWDARSGAELRSLPHGHKVVSVDISRDGTLLSTASYDKAARVWDSHTGKLVAEMKGHAAPLLHAAFSPSGRELATACVDFTARLWTVRPSQPVALPAGDDLRVVDADVAADGKTIVEAYRGDKTARVLDLATRRELVRLEGPAAAIRVARFSPDGTRIVTGSEDGTARLWETRTGALLGTVIGHDGVVHQVTFSPDGCRVLTLAGRTARVWSAVDGAEIMVHRAADVIHTAALSPDSELLILSESGVGDLRIAKLVDVSSGSARRWMPEEKARFGAADFGPDGERVVVTSATTRAHIRRLSDGGIEATLLHPSRVTYAVYSPDKRWILTRAHDEVARIWDAVSYEKRLDIKSPGKVQGYAHFTAGSRSLVVAWYTPGDRAGLAPELVIYPLDVLGEALNAKFGDLTPDERDHFQVGSPEERRKHRAAWRGGHVYGEGPAAER